MAEFKKRSTEQKEKAARKYAKVAGGVRKADGVYKFETVLTETGEIWVGETQPIPAFQNKPLPTIKGCFIEGENLSTQVEISLISYDMLDEIEQQIEQHGCAYLRAVQAKTALRTNFAPAIGSEILQAQNATENETETFDLEAAKTEWLKENPTAKAVIINAVKSATSQKEFEEATA